MRKRSVGVLLVTLMVLFLSAPFALAEEQTGTIIIIDEQQGVYTVKGDDGKEYQITQELVVGMDLQTGDTVIMEIEEATPVKVRKK
jgi:hypothetical protein